MAEMSLRELAVGINIKPDRTFTHETGIEVDEYVVSDLRTSGYRKITLIWVKRGKLAIMREGDEPFPLFSESALLPNRIHLVQMEKEVLYDILRRGLEPAFAFRYAKKELS